MKNKPSYEEQYRRYALYEKGHKPYTIKQTISIVKRLTAFFPEHSVDTLTTPIIRDFLLTQREQAGWSAKTFRIYRQYLKTFFDWLVIAEYTMNNPILAIDQPRLPQRLPRPLDTQQTQSVMAQVHWYPWHMELEKYRNEAIFSTLLFTGIRLSELINLRKHHVNLGNNEILIFNGKGEKDRIVPILRQLKPILLAYEKAFQRLGTPSPWYFPSVKSEKRLTSKNIYSIFRKISQRSDIKITPHMFRHTFGRICIESKINMRVVQPVMGHSRLETTQIYTHVSTEASKNAMHDFNFYL